MQGDNADRPDLGTQHRTCVVVVLHYGTANKTIDCVRSIPKDGYPLVVVDNGPEVLAEGMIRYPFDFTVLHSRTNVGYAGGMTAGIEQALKLQPDFVLLVTNDIRLDEGTVKTLISTAAELPSLGALGPAITLADTGELWAPRPSTIIEALGDQKSRVTELVGAILLLKRQAIERVDRFDEAFFMYGEDTDLCRRLIAAGYFISVDWRARASHVLSNRGFYTAKYQVYYRSRNMILLQWKSVGPGKKMRKVIRLVRLTLLYHGPHLILLVRHGHLDAISALAEGWLDAILWAMRLRGAGMKSKFKHGD